ncbi:alkaline phosphatase family protein, partial [Bacillus cereus group sp. BC22]|uniref:alkaline phosphatase family protein n=1 Tax=Bacillus cereus group sp. BC22 TaxID=3445341 RepID=UPI003F21F01E
QQDLAWYVRTHPRSALARLTRGGVEYSRARTPFPSDSFPGMVGQVTGGDPGVTGIYYDDTFSHGVFPPGTTKCTGPAPGGAVDYDESDDLKP